MTSGPLTIGAGTAAGEPPAEPPVVLGRPGAAGRGLDAVRYLLRDGALAFPVALLVALLLFAAIVPVVWDKGADTQNLLSALSHPSASHPMGTDSLGRDVLARVAAGARISLLVAFIVSLAGALIGGAIGVLAGTFSGWTDTVMMRLMDAILAFPPLILAMAVTVGLGVGLRSAAIGITVVSIPWYARLLRSEATRIRSLPFIEAAAAAGSSRRRIVLRHVLPHLLPMLYIQLAAAFGYAILALAGLSFVGLGAQVPTPEWGAMITDGLSYSLTGQWWVAVFPGVLLLVAVTAASMLSDRVRDLLDPRGSYARI